MRFCDARALFDERCAAGKIINRKTGELQSISTNTRHVILSSVRAGLRRATGLMVVDDVELAPYLETLPAHAKAAAADTERPANAADRVRRFLAVVEGREYARARGGAGYVLPAWQPVYDAIASLKKNNGAHPSDILRMQNVALVGGVVRSPAELPDLDTVTRWALEQGLTLRAITRMVQTYRRGRRMVEDVAGGEALAPIAGTRKKLRGVLGLPDLMDRLAAAGYAGTRPPATIDALRLLAPFFAEGLTFYLGSPAVRSYSPVWRKRQLGAVSRVVAELIRAGYDTRTMEPIALVELTHGQVADAGVSSLATRAMQREVVTARSLLRFLVERAAAASQANSPLQLAQSTAQPAVRLAGREEVGFYTGTMQGDVLVLQALTRCNYEIMRTASPERWTTIERVYADTLLAMKHHNQPLRFLNQKDKLRILAQVTYPQLVCVGLPLLRQKVLTLRMRYRRALRAHEGRRDVPAVSRRRARYVTWLRRYLVLAVMTSDGLRVKNYTGGRVGVHFVPTVRRDRRSGAWLSFEQVETRWRGFDDPIVSLKVATDENGGERRREGRLLRPGIVDLELLFEYWTDVRVDDLVCAGRLASRAAYNPDADDAALFVSAKSRHADARYGTAASSRLYGRALHWVCVKALGRTALPGWGSAEHRADWRSLLSGHIARLLAATYWGGIREKWGEACRLTDDTRVTLARSYSKVSARMEELMHVTGPENPHHFDALLDRIQALEVIDWETRAVRRLTRRALRPTGAAAPALGDAGEEGDA